MWVALGHGVGQSLNPGFFLYMATSIHEKAILPATAWNGIAIWCPKKEPRHMLAHSSMAAEQEAPHD